MNYEQWNQLLLGHFFSEEMADRRVYINVTRQILEDLGDNDGFDDFISAIHRDVGVNWESNLCCIALRHYQKWCSDKKQHPTYFAYLVLFALAASMAGEHGLDTRAYYPHLRWLLLPPEKREQIKAHRQNTGQLRDFDQMRQLWKGLEEWSIKSVEGQYGRYVFNTIGKMKHVGIPFSQALMTSRDRNQLPAIFHEAKLRPLAPPNKEVLLRSILDFGHRRLLPRTLCLINGKNPEARLLFGEMIREELLNWDGEYEDDKVVTRTSAYLELRLCLSFITGSRVHFTLRCRANRDFPEPGVNLLHRGEEFRAEPCVDEWSYPIYNVVPGQDLDCLSFPWTNDLVMHTDTHRVVKEHGCKVRFFEESYFSEGMYEVPQISPHTRTYIAVHLSDRYKVEKWGINCDGFHLKPIKDGLPKEWLLYYADALDIENCPYESAKSTSESMRLALQGGIRSVKGKQRYYYFAPPNIKVDRWQPTPYVTAIVDQQEYQLEQPCPDKAPAWYGLPEHILKPGSMRITLKLGNEVITSKSFTLDRYDSSSEASLPVCWFDGSYKPLGHTCSRGVAGATLVGVYIPEHEISALPSGLAKKARWLLTIGQSMLASGAPSLQIPSDTYVQIRQASSNPVCTQLLNMVCYPVALLQQLQYFARQVAAFIDASPKQHREPRMREC